ncbi:MAG: transporter substrate-binding domain-containing protein [Xanthomonadaceae bacterium]|nr:transporter substrate-binding domain-containing protein [Xanthomonadaceae bacterium]
MLNRNRAARPLLLLLALLPAAVSADTITIESDYWIPYNGAPGSGKEGYMIDLLRAIAAESGDEVDYRLMDWDTAVTRSLQGSVDCVVGAFVEDTPDHAMTSSPWGLSENVFLSHVENIPRLESLEDLRTLRIGAVADYSYGEQIDAILADPEVQVTRQRSSRQAFPHLVMKLITRSVDVVIEDANVANAALTELNMRGRVVPVRDDLTEPDEIHVACTPNARGQALVARFDAGLKAARESGLLAETLARYGLEDWAQ